MQKFNPFEDISERLERIENFLIAMNDRELAVLKNKEFYTPKEFSDLTGIKYSTVIYRCKNGRLKSRQDTPCSSWQIDAKELDRYREEAKANMY